MNKKSIFIIGTISIVLLGLLRFCPDPFADHLSKKQISELVIQNEELLRSLLNEIQDFPFDILSVSTTEKMKIYESEYAHIQSLYICRKEDEKYVYERIENDVFKGAMELEGLIEISVWNHIIEFYCGGRGFGTATSYYGFAYYIDPSITESA